MSLLPDKNVQLTQTTINPQQIAQNLQNHHSNYNNSSQASSNSNSKNNNNNSNYNEDLLKFTESEIFDKEFEKLLRQPQSYNNSSNVKFNAFQAPQQLPQFSSIMNSQQGMNNNPMYNNLNNQYFYLPQNNQINNLNALKILNNNNVHNPVPNQIPNNNNNNPGVLASKCCHNRSQSCYNIDLNVLYNNNTLRASTLLQLNHPHLPQ
jgi:hypothetical protein